jgi:ABC-type dipeptide/oligopeptide/nickel transport system permease subunit
MEWITIALVAVGTFIGFFLGYVLGYNGRDRRWR